MTALGLFATNGNDVQQFQSWLGEGVDFVSANTGRAGWSDWQGSILWTAGWTKPLNIPVHWTLPMFADGGTLTAAANGDYNSHYVQAANDILNASTGQDQIVIRVGTEFNGNWFPWAAAGHEQDFVQAYHQFVDAFRSVSNKFVFEWNVAIGAQGMDPASAYPGDDYVDIIGGDFYYTKWLSTDPDQAWNQMLNQRYGLHWLSEFAAAHGKPMGFSEWGVQTDNAQNYIANVAKWFASNNVAYQSYWDSNSGGFAGKLSTGQYPNTAAAFQTAFGPPAAPVISSHSDSGTQGDHITNTSTLTLGGSAVANSKVTVFEGTTQVGTATVNSDGTWGLTTSALKNGVHHFTAIDTDGASHNSVASADFAVTVDTSAPMAPTLAHYSQAGAAIGAATSFNDLLLKGAAEANSRVSIWDSGKLIGTVTADSGGAWSFDTGTLSTGAHSFTSKAMDVAGNTSVASATDAVTVTAPAAALSSIKFTAVNGDTPNHVVNFTGTADGNSQLKFYDNGTFIGQTITKSYGGWSFTTDNPLSDDIVHTIAAQEYNGAGKLVGTSPSAIVIGSSFADTLNSTSGNDILSGHGGSDTFVFTAHFGNDVIKDFAATGSAHDVVEFHITVFTDFASVLSHASQQGNDVVISTGADTMTLKWTKLGSLNSEDFHFS